MNDAAIQFDGALAGRVASSSTDGPGEEQADTVSPSTRPSRSAEVRVMVEAIDRAVR